MGLSETERREKPMDGAGERVFPRARVADDEGAKGGGRTQGGSSEGGGLGHTLWGGEQGGGGGEEGSAMEEWQAGWRGGERVTSRNT